MDKGRSNRRLIGWLRALGVMALLMGAAALWIAPAEVQVLYLFLPGAKFAYEGYNWGTILFALIATQLLAYYALGLLGLGLGWGHVSLRAWARPLTRSLLWAWLVAGAPLMALAYLLLILSKGMTPTALLLSLPFALLFYPLVPGLLYRWYGSRGVRQAFATREASASGAWQGLPASVGGTIALLLLYALSLHLPLMVNGVFPWFGILLAGKAGLTAYGPLTIVSVVTLWAQMTRRRWAWGVALAGLSVWTLSNALTFARYTLADILQLMQLPPTELSWFQGMPFLHQPVGLLCCLPPLGLILLLLLNRHSYRVWCMAAASDIGAC